MVDMDVSAPLPPTSSDCVHTVKDHHPFD
jgi:hypothetical protein